MTTKTSSNGTSCSNHVVVSHCFRYIIISYFALGRWAKYCDQHVCMPVCPLTYRKKPRVQISPDFQYMSPTLLLYWRQCNTLCTFGFAGDFTVSYNGTNGSQSKYVSSSSAGGGTKGEVCRLRFVFTCDILLNSKHDATRFLSARLTTYLHR